MTLDNDGYPDDATLELIKTWDITNGYAYLIDIIRASWKFGIDEPTHITTDEKDEYLQLTLHTLGWSGNEDIIRALNANITFTAICWERTERGGHHTYHIPIQFLNKQR